MRWPGRGFGTGKLKEREGLACKIRGLTEWPTVQVAGWEESKGPDCKGWGLVGWA